jgi:sugar lactone lactonase YvrE
MRNPTNFRLILTLVTMLGVNAAAEDAPPLIPADVKVETVADGFKFTEGPALAPDGSIYFTDIPNHRIHRFDPETGEATVMRENSGGANGLFASSSSLYICEGANRQLRYTGFLEDGTIPPDRLDFGESESELFFTHFDGARLNSPNDLAVDSEGAVYVTDPRYGKRDDMQMKVEGVYYWEPMKWDHDFAIPARSSRLIDNLVRPNGIALSPDEKTLYVADHGAKKIMAYPLLAPGKVGEGKVLYDTDTGDASGGGPDGMCVDHAGRLYVAIFDAGGILILSPEGERLGFIETGKQTTNCTFGADGRTLYVTADKSLKRVVLNTGAPPPQPPAELPARFK